jgi:hypothetical protein
VSYTIPCWFSGRTSICRSQLRTTVSSSVAAGDVRHVMALTLSAAQIISPRIPGAVVVLPK